MSHQGEGEMLERICVTIIEDFGDNRRSRSAVTELKAGFPENLFCFDSASNFIKFTDTTRELLVLFNQLFEQRRRIFPCSAEQLGHSKRGSICFAIVTQHANARQELNSRQAFRALPTSHRDHADFAG